MNFIFDGFALDLDRRELRRGDAIVVIQPQVFDLLVYLVRNRDRVVSKDDILDAVWRGRIVSESSLTSRINAVRTALGDSGKDQRLIRTLPRKGFRFVGSVREGEVSAPATTVQLQVTELSVSTSGGAPSGSDQWPVNGALPSLARLPLLNIGGESGNLRLVDARGGPAALRQNTQAKIAEAPILSIVVMPFLDFSPAKNQRFIDAIGDILITELSRVPQLFVIARHTAASYSGKQIDARQIGRELGVRYLVEGSVQVSSGLGRMNAQLIDTENGGHLWAERFDMPCADRFGVQDEIASRLSRSISLEITAAESRRMQRDRHDGTNATGLVVQGWAKYHARMSIDEAREARRMFEEALRLDDNNVDALLGIADTHLWEISCFSSDARAEQLAAAEAALARAWPLEGDTVRIRIHTGRLHAARGAPERALREFNLAKSLDPNCPFPHAWMGLMKIYVGRAEETEGHVAEALRLSPNDPVRAFWYQYLGIADHHLGRLERAVDHLWHSIEVTPPGMGIFHFYLASALALLGRASEAQAACAIGCRLTPGFTIGRFRSGTMSDHPVFLAQRERVYEGLRKAGLAE